MTFIIIIIIITNIVMLRGFDMIGRYPIVRQFAFVGVYLQ